MADQEKAEEKAAEETAPPSGGRSAGDLREVADDLRKRVDLFGKTLAAVATLGTTAVGLEAIGDLFPIDGNGWWLVLACSGLFLAAMAALYVAVRLMNAAKPVFMSIDLEHSGLRRKERKAVEPVYEGAAQRFGYTTLAGLEQRERALRKAAARTSDADERARRTALADEVKTEIEQALARGQVVAVRRRATNAVGDWKSVLLYAVFILGLIGFALGSDAVSDGRTDAVAVAKACGEARKAGATSGDLEQAKDVCKGEAKATTPKEVSSAQARAEVTTALTKALTACAELVKKEAADDSGPLQDTDCDPVREALTRVNTVTGTSEPAP